MLLPTGSLSTLGGFIGAIVHAIHQQDVAFSACIPLNFPIFLNVGKLVGFHSLGVSVRGPALSGSLDISQINLRYIVSSRIVLCFVAEHNPEAFVLLVLGNILIPNHIQEFCGNFQGNGLGLVAYADGTVFRGRAFGQTLSYPQHIAALGHGAGAGYCAVHRMVVLLEHHNAVVRDHSLFVAVLKFHKAKRRLQFIRNGDGSGIRWHISQNGVGKLLVIVLQLRMDIVVDVLLNLGFFFIRGVMNLRFEAQL